jgi:hypothetical protein
MVALLEKTRHMEVALGHADCYQSLIRRTLARIIACCVASAGWPGY